MRAAPFLGEHLQMRTKTNLLLAVMALALVGATGGSADKSKDANVEITHTVVTSDTILAGIIASLLPPDRYSVEAVLPPGQCPGHYDVKLSDIEKMQKATLTVSFTGLPFMEKAALEGGATLLVAPADRNWMAPDSYVYGVGVLADELSKRFPEDKEEIARRKEATTREVAVKAHALIAEIKRAGVFGKPIIASSMQKEPLEWMGFRVVGAYGRQEAISTREIVHLAEVGRDQQAIMVVDNLQSGPDAGKGLAETLGAPHVVLTNYPSEEGYLHTLGENVSAVLAAAENE